MESRRSRQPAEAGGRRTAYLVSAGFGAIVIIFGGIAGYLYSATTGPQDFIGIFVAFAWTFLSVGAEIAILARLGLFRQTDVAIEPSPPEPTTLMSFERSVFFGVSHEASVSAQARIMGTTPRRGLMSFMLVSAVCLALVQMALYQSGRSTFGGFVFACIPVAFMIYWAWLKRSDPAVGQHASPNAPETPGMED